MKDKLEKLIQIAKIKIKKNQKSCSEPKMNMNVQIKSISKKEKRTIQAEESIKDILEGKSSFSSRKYIWASLMAQTVKNLHSMH